MTSRLIKLVQGFGGQRVLLVGDLILDRYVYGDADRISPEAPVPILRKRADEERVGGTGSVAVNLKELGIDVYCCGAVGLDDAGHRVRALLEAQGVGTRGILSASDRPTTTKTRLIGLAQHRHRQQLMRVDEEVTRDLTPEDAQRLESLVFNTLSEVQAVCIEDYRKGLITDAFCQAIIQAARQAGKPVLIDPARLHNYARYYGATLLTPNRTEFCMASGCQDNSLECVLGAAPAMVARHNLDALLVTLDREGAVLARRDVEPIHIPTRERAVYDNTGAGDAVLAMLVAATVAGASWEEATRLTNVAGGLEVEKFGCIPIQREEVIAELQLSAGPAGTKIRDRAGAAAEIALLKSRGKRIVFTNGCYDLLHIGHTRFLDQCRKFGDVVVVGLNSDASVRAQAKGSDRPIVPQAQRAEVLAGLASVDYIVIFDEPTPKEIVDELTPDVLVKGEDWAERGVVGREHVERHGGRVELIPLVEGFSTTSIVERIRASNPS